MDKYQVLISPKAFRDLDEIYTYIKEELFAENAALQLVEEIEQAILSLDTMPYKNPERKVGRYAGQGYRQIFVKNWIIIYRIEENSGIVVIITVVYMHRNI